MLAAEHTQSLTDFRQKAAETLDRLNKTGEAEIITVNGEARAVLLSPAVYDEMVREVQLARDVTVIRRALQQYEAGEGQELHTAMDEIRATLLGMKAAKEGAKEGGGQPPARPDRSKGGVRGDVLDSLPGRGHSRSCRGR